MEGTSEAASGPQRVERDRPQGQPCVVRLEAPGGQVGQWSGLGVRDHLLDQDVLPALQLRLHQGERAVCEDRVVTPRGGRLGLPGRRFAVQAADPTYDEAGGDLLSLLAAGEGGVGGLGDLGVGDQLAGVGVRERLRVLDRGPGALENRRDGGDSGTATAMNLARLDAWLTGTPWAGTRISRFERLRPVA
ncbi:hypothetical protein [Kitasatospora sp. NPDC088351]|uniref:hypothetical protein n=1 Tax=Kitasatospora sp. NPDC088351 TaxID=3155180 RepID=UPI00341EC225